MDYVDLRDVIKNKDKDPDEFAMWEEACKEKGQNIQWFADHYGVMVPEENFEDYAREMAEDIGAIKDSSCWPADYIDWKRAANALQYDYTTIEVDGTTYYYRG